MKEEYEKEHFDYTKVTTPLFFDNMIFLYNMIFFILRW